MTGASHGEVAPPRGRIIFLNGTSSSGKSSIAQELLNVLDEPYFHLPVDAFHAMRTRREYDPADLPVLLKRTWMGFHRAVAGMAARQFDQVHAHDIYDVECDTGAASPLDCARQIKDFLPRRPALTAFEQLRSRLGAPEPATPAAGTVRSGELSAEQCVGRLR